MAETVFLIKICVIICIDICSVIIHLLFYFCSVNEFRFCTSFVPSNYKQALLFHWDPKKFYFFSVTRQKLIYCLIIAQKTYEISIRNYIYYT